MKYTKENLRQTFQQPFCLDTWKGIVKNLFQDRELLIDPEEIADSPDDIAGYFLGQFTTSDKYTVGLFHYKVLKGEVNKKKVALRHLVHTFINPKYGDFNAALVVFEGQGKWRLSFICDIKGLSTAPKRFTFLFGEEDKQYKTAVSRFIQLQRSKMEFADIKKAFSVEELSKDFYERLFHWYEWAMSEKAGVTFPSNPKASPEERESMNIKIIRLITRLLFVWFIKQKQLVPDCLFTPDFLKTVLKGFDKDSSTDGCYYNAILQNLFFATLNCPIRDEEDNSVPLRTFASNNPKDKRDTRNKYRYPEMFSISQQQVIEMFERVPFLNGGLFDCLDKPQDLYLDLDHDILHDGFSRNATKDANGKHKYRAFIPNNLFFSEDEKQPGLITLLNEYNFTIEENSTDDAEISLDPELLGCVFENLLADYNPETQESARKSTGSFYTPRVVVDYMVDEALIAYLASQHISGIEEADIRQLFLSHEKTEKWGESQSAGIETALKQIKILDPACGSGAFPMGCLLRIVDIIETLHGGEINRYEHKLAIIENCIYGGDIQSIAMLICKLRFFISLICEQKDIDFSKPEDNFGVHTLPNLETKFVAANSLISASIRQYDDGWIKDTTLQQLKEELLHIRNQHFQAKKRSIKQNCQKADKAKRKEIYDYLVDTLYNPNESFIAERKAEIERQNALLESLKGKVYLDELEAVKQTDLFGRTSLFSRDINEEKRKEAERRIKNLEAEVETERAKAGLKGFDAAVKQLTDWDPYDQNSVSPFFDPEWMFCNDKFDIVIGNPPYIELSKNKGELSKLYADCGYDTFRKDGNIYCLFYERGYQLLNDNGHLCYITSNKWMRGGYGENTRHFFATKTNPQLLLDFGGVQVFNSATVDTNILLFAKTSNEHRTISARMGMEYQGNLGSLNFFMKENGKIFDFPSDDTWVMLSPIEKEIKRKVEAIGTPLNDWNINIRRGILTGHNEAFFISTAKRNEILSNCQSEDERKRTEKLIRPILRGKDIKCYSCNWAGLWLINTHNGLRGKLTRIDINDYPAVKHWLDNGGIAYNGKMYGGYEDIAHRSDQGDTPYNLRNCAYLEDFNKPKIIYPNMTKFLPFVYDDKAFMTNQKCFIITGRNIAYLTAFLNSSLFKFCFRDSFPELRDDTRELSKIFFDEIPVKPVSDEEDKSFQRAVEDIQAHYTKEKAIAIDNMIFDLYNLTQEERETIGFVEIH